MTTRQAWLAIAAVVLLTAYFVLGAVLTVTHQARVWVPQTVAPAVPASIEGAP